MYSPSIQQALIRVEEANDRFERHLYELKGYVESVRDNKLRGDR